MSQRSRLVTSRITDHFFTIFEIHYPPSYQLILIRLTAHISVSDLVLWEACDFLLYVCSAVSLYHSPSWIQSSCFTSLKLQENRCSRYRTSKNLLSTNNLPQSLFALSLTFSPVFFFPSQPTTQMPQRQHGLKVSVFTIHFLTLSCAFIQEHTLLREAPLAIARWQDHGRTGS